MTVSLSPIHPCGRCGALVQLAERSFGRTRLEDPETGQRHECAPLPPVRPLGLRECPDCEKADVFEFEGALYAAWCVTLPMARWQRHECAKEVAQPSGTFRKLPKTSTIPAPVPITPPVKVEMAETGPRQRRNYDG